MIDLKAAWKTINSNALILLQSQLPYCNKRRGLSYKIKRVTQTRIDIEVRNGEDKYFTERSLLTQLKKLNAANGIINYHEFFGNVAKETTVVTLMH